MTSVVLVTPARDEEDNLQRLVDAVVAQTLVPERWTIVDTGSSDRTVEIARAAATRHPWIDVVELPPSRIERGGPVVAAIECAARRQAAEPDLFVNVDADVSFDTDFLRRLADAFASDPSLGIASGTCLELEQGAWRERFVTGASAWGATRAYRWSCFRAVTPLERRVGWDGIDELRAQARGWQTSTLRDLPFRHHRPEGQRDAGWRGWASLGETAWFMGYSPAYLTARTAFRMLRRPAAAGLLVGYVRSAVARRDRLDDVQARRHLADRQRIRSLPRRLREARGR